jgi:hypothetical protein
VEDFSPGRFKRVSFSVRKGEVFGFAGLVGSGRRRGFIEEAKLAARDTILNFLALLEQYIGDLNSVESFVMLLVFVASSPDFKAIGGLECL